MISEHFGVPPPVACALGVAFGFAFWWLVERTFRSDPVRRPMVACIDQVFSCMTRWRGDEGIRCAAPAPAVEAPH